MSEVLFPPALKVQVISSLLPPQNWARRTAALEEPRMGLGGHQNHLGNKAERQISGPELQEF